MFGNFFRSKSHSLRKRKSIDGWQAVRWEARKSQYSKLWKEQNKICKFTADSNALERNNINALERIPYIQNSQSNSGKCYTKITRRLCSLLLLSLTRTLRSTGLYGIKNLTSRNCNIPGNSPKYIVRKVFFTHSGKSQISFNHQTTFMVIIENWVFQSQHLLRQSYILFTWGAMWRLFWELNSSNTKNSLC